MDKSKLKKEKRGTIILSDFDGTISVQDVNNAIFSRFGDSYSYIIEDKFKNNLISDRKALTKQYKRLNLRKQEFVNFIKNNIRLDPYFKIFYKNINREKFDFVIISGGFLEYIKITFEKEKIEYNDEIFANSLKFKEDNVKPIFLHDIRSCDEVFGPCGNCKYKMLKKYTDREIIYIGDGLTDRCVSKMVDYLLVKKDSILKKYCKKNEIDYLEFTSFKEVNEIINNLLDN